MFVLGLVSQHFVPKPLVSACPPVARPHLKQYQSKTLPNLSVRQFLTTMDVQNAGDVLILGEGDPKFSVNPKLTDHLYLSYQQIMSDIPALTVTLSGAAGEIN